MKNFTKDRPLKDQPDRNLTSGNPSARRITPTKQQEVMARFFTAISHKRRLMIFKLLLQHGAKGMRHDQLLIFTQMAVSTLGHHLRQMEKGGLLARHQKGQHVWFAIDFGTLNTQMGLFSRSARPSY